MHAMKFAFFALETIKPLLPRLWYLRFWWWFAERAMKPWVRELQRMSDLLDDNAAAIRRMVE